MTTPDTEASEILRTEFNRWAEEGRGEEMEGSHVPIVEPMLALMNLQPAEGILDLGCGSGWLVRRLARLVIKGSVTGIDVSDQMIHRAQDATSGVPNVEFRIGTAEQIPAPADTFTKVVSVESAYYWRDPARGMADILRVLQPGGSAWILINFYRDNPDCHQWRVHYRMTTHLLSAAQWQDLFRSAGFQDVSHRRIPDLSPTAEIYTGRWFRDADQMRRFKLEGALLVIGTKPR
jgi:arsenite methyltransferase